MSVLVENSINGNSWVLNHGDSSNIAKLYSLNPIVASILANRNIALDKINSFLNPKLKDQMSNPLVLKDVLEGCITIKKALDNNCKIVIFGDYDVDGITSSVMMYNYLNNFTSHVVNYLPDRYANGYGLTPSSLEDLLKLNPQCVILLDNGSSSVNEVEKLRQLSIDVVIIDHHSVDYHNKNTSLPPANSFINPKRIDDTSGLDFLCSAGLVFMFLVALNNYLLLENNIKDNKKIDLLPYLDLVAMGTICDMVPLIGVNRAFVFQGLHIMQKRQNIGLRAIYDELKINQPINYETIGFTIGPLINCGSRMGNSYLPLKLLLIEDSLSAENLAKQLIELNKDRQKEEAKIIELAIEELSNKSNENTFIFEGSSQYLSGIIGIVAGRLKEIYKKPALVYSIDENTKICTCSGRSIDGIDLGNIIIQAKNQGLLIKGGGHSQAVGFSFNLEKLDEIRNFFDSKFKHFFKNHIKKNLEIDCVIPINAINIELAKNLQLLQPYGISFSEPLFMLSNVHIKNIKQIGANKNHLQIEVGDGFKYYLKAFCYKCLPSVLGEFLLNHDNSFVNLVVSIKLNLYQGKEYVNLVLLDAYKSK